MVLARASAAAALAATVLSLAGRAAAVELDAGDAAALCKANPKIVETGSDWMSAGQGAASLRFQPTPRLTAAEVPRLRLKWAFAMTGGGMPTVLGGRVFVTNRSGRFYALDAQSGCVLWARRDVFSRATPVIARSTAAPGGWMVLTGERNRTVRALDAETGQHLWRSAELETHPAASITASPTVHDGVVFAPITSSEEARAEDPAYPCCSFRGSLSALDLATGRVLWKTHTVAEPLRPTRRNSAGVQMQGPAGGAIWSSPTTDAARGLVYVATGDSYTDAPTAGADAVIAMEMKTGKIRWRRQVTAGDNFVNGCDRETKAANCPVALGGDFDFGASPVLLRLASGKGLLAAGQKSGLVYGLDPDSGVVRWTTRVGAGSEQGGIQWGMASDGRRLFAANSDLVNLSQEASRAQGAAPAGPAREKARPGLTALDPATGKPLWTTPAPVAPCRHPAGRNRIKADLCLRAQSAAPSAIPGAVFSGTMDGWLRAYDGATGKIIWAYSTTAQTYDTLNGVKGQAGDQINGMGPAIAGGMVYVMSGYGNNGEMNVLLAFSVDGK